MIQVSKDEAARIRKSGINTHMRRTAHKYYAEESPALLRFLGRTQKRPSKGVATC